MLVLHRKRFKRLAAVFIAIISTVMLLCCSENEQNPAAGTTGKEEHITVAHAQFEPTALFCIAEDQGYFGENGLRLTTQQHNTGVGALDAVLRGEADIAVGTAEFPLVAKAFRKESIAAFGSIGRTEFIYLIARKDRGIEKIPDLKGKRIGTTAGTIAEFYLGRFLELNRMQVQDITFVDIAKPADYADAVASGRVDAIVSAQPNADAVKKRLAGNSVAWLVQSHQPLYSLIISKSEWLSRHPQQVRGFLHSLAQAEEFAIRNPEGAKAIVQKGLKLEPGYMETVWSQNQYSLSLEQSLILVMEDEARWMIANNLTSETVVPDFLKYIHADGLMEVRPKAVNLIK